MSFLRATSRLSSVARSIVPRRAASSVAEIETRWVKLPECEQGVIADSLAAAQKGDWKKMTLEQKRAAYFVAYGPYGARTPIDPSLNWRVTGWVAVLLALAIGGWQYSVVFRPKLRTHTPEWAEATKQKAIEAKQNPFSGYYAKERKEKGE
ncbi:hypothetical protein SmJEL517_g00055 [Synchytrium microbalum]|uniref:Cytochrome c oxidase subunit IV n=1 Tax=Synchytrium microbalum TaxID=1806994 RepID=A0A507CB30_9FUNG|nr:uncharacterized protein SmJEL517_g00055 [Synchytrium microbalum]TPX38267.1 hypothetical protein SmJEL517_g00055 [Synchytrium microbalum]